MHFYKPGPFEEYVAKLSAISAKPMPDAWEEISAQLDVLARQKKMRIVRIMSLAACMLILISISVPMLIISSSQILPSQLAETVSLSRDKIVAQSIPYEPITPEATASNQPNYISPPQLLNTPIASSIEALNRPNEIANFENETTVFADATQEKEEVEFIELSKRNINTDEITVVEKKKKNLNSWSIIGYLNSSFSYHTYGAFNYKQNPNETGAWMVGGDLLFRKKFGKYVSVYSGISISPTGQNISNLILLKNKSNEDGMEYLYANTSYGMVSLDDNAVAISNFSNLPNAPENLLRSAQVNTANLEQRFYYMQIPFIVSSNVSAGIFDIEFKLGAAAGLLINNKFEVYSSRGHFTGKTEEIRKFNASALGAVSVSVPVTQQVDLIVEPNIQIYFNPLSYNYAITYPFATSIKVGVGYNF
ncbi:MAG TPA: hypothetical protein ENN24_06060 [Bacteroidetes bacterium]|nr:hypothetical protein [Bacteroidota bacterium]